MGELPPRLVLIARSREKELGRFTFERGTVTVGSAEGNDLVLADATVSRKHLELSTRGGALLVKDLESRNGTRYQGSKIREAFVPVGAVLVLGEVELRLEADDAGARAQLGPLVSVSPPMMEALRALERVAKTDTTVLLEAETGSGKEVTARAIHEASARAGKPFETVDCSSLAKELAASELFGHVKGAFTGADRDAAGRVRARRRRHAVPRRDRRAAAGAAAAAVARAGEPAGEAGGRRRRTARRRAGRRRHQPRPRRAR